jgi:hypothetical protein
MHDNQMTTKKAVVVLGFLILLVVTTLIIPARWVGVKPSTTKRSPLVLKSTEELAVLTKDTDKNNSPDWKDLLLETTSTSTIGVANKYVVTEADKKRLADPNNITASFSKNLYTVASYAKKSGQMTQAEQQAIVTDLLSKESEKIDVKVYTLDDIKIASTETTASKRAYGNELGKVFKKATGFKLDIIDLDKIKAYSTSKDPAILESFTIKKNNTKVIIDELLKISVPGSAVPYHLLMVNRLSEYLSILESFAGAKDDPMRATIAFNKFLPIVKALFSSLENMSLYFKLEDITFTSNEPGYVLSAGYTTK